MKNLMKKIRKSNKGFTLVELIIVVAIIAILSAVLAPKYIQYVERARESNDAEIAAAIREAALVANIDPVNECNSANTYTVTWTPGTSIVVASSVDTDAADTAMQTDIVSVIAATTAAESKYGKEHPFVIGIKNGEVVAGTNTWDSIMN